MVDNCRGAPGTQERTCHHSTELHEVYQQRANISQEASLVLKNVQPEDAGMYQITVQGLDVLGAARVTLIVEESRQDAIPAVGKGITLEVNPVMRKVSPSLIRDNTRIEGSRKEVSPMVTKGCQGETSPLVTEDDGGEAKTVVMGDYPKETNPSRREGNRGHDGP